MSLIFCVSSNHQFSKPSKVCWNLVGSSRRHWNFGAAEGGNPDNVAESGFVAGRWTLLVATGTLEYDQWLHFFGLKSANWAVFKTSVGWWYGMILYYTANFIWNSNLPRTGNLYKPSSIEWERELDHCTTGWNKWRLAYGKRLQKTKWKDPPWIIAGKTHEISMAADGFNSYGTN